MDGGGPALGVPEDQKEGQPKADSANEKMLSAIGIGNRSKLGFVELRGKETIAKAQTLIKNTKTEEERSGALVAETARTQRKVRRK